MTSILSVSALSHLLASSSSLMPVAQVGMRALGNRLAATSASTQESTHAAATKGQPTRHDAWSYLLDVTLTSGRAPADRSASLGLASYYHARHFSSAVPHSTSTSSSVAPTHQEHTAAIELPANDGAADLSAAAATATTATRSWLSATWLARCIPKAQPRVKGLSRKLVLRQINRQIIARVARRATIGIPVLGFCFVSKVLVKDLARCRSELSTGDWAIAGCFAAAAAADVLDLAAQLTIISGLAHVNLGVGIAGAAALLVAADKASMATAALSFSCALAGEQLALARRGVPAEGDRLE